LTEWFAWQQAHPDTLVLSKTQTCAQFNCGAYASNSLRPYQIDPYESYYATSEAGVINSNIPRGANSDEAKQRVIGIRIAGTARAYPFSVLAKTPVINDRINGVPVLVAFDPETETAAAYLRELNSRSLTFLPSPKNSALIIDEQNGSEWLISTGTAVGGSLKDSQLPALISTTAFEFGWYDYFPNSETFSPRASD
jgi:hypothetical protein